MRFFAKISLDKKFLDIYKCPVFKCCALFETKNNTRGGMRVYLDKFNTKFYMLVIYNWRMPPPPLLLMRSLASEPPAARNKRYEKHLRDYAEELEKYAKENELEAPPKLMLFSTDGRMNEETKNNKLSEYVKELRAYTDSLSPSKGGRSRKSRKSRRKGRRSSRKSFFGLF